MSFINDLIKLKRTTKKASTAIKGFAFNNAPFNPNIHVNGHDYDIVSYANDCLGTYTEESGKEAKITGTKTIVKPTAYLLPWKSDHICICTIGQGPTVFLTYRMNSCAVFISGDDQGPTVVHANTGNIVPTLDKNNLINQFSTIYNAMAQELVNQNLIDDDNLTIFQPGDYEGFGGVFGICRGTAWKFYGHSHINSTQARTWQIWPDEAEIPKSGCCYITTAVCKGMGLADDCDELQTLRWFRDEVMSRTAQGRAEVAEYYKTAPAIVAALAVNADAGRIYRELYSRFIRPAVMSIKQGRLREAHAQYREMVRALAAFVERGH